MITSSENWKQILLDSDNIELLRHVLSTIDSLFLVNIYRNSFKNPREARSMLWLKVPLGKTTAIDIVNGSKALLENYEGFIEAMVDGWINSFSEEEDEEKPSVPVDTSSPHYYLAISGLALKDTTSEGPTWELIAEISQQTLDNQLITEDEVKVFPNTNEKALKRENKLKEKLDKQMLENKNHKLELKELKSKVKQLDKEVSTLKTAKRSFDNSLEKKERETELSKQKLIIAQTQIETLNLQLKSEKKDFKTKLVIIEKKLQDSELEVADLKQAQDEHSSNQDLVVLPSNSNFESSLIIDYDFLGQNSSERVSGLLEVFAAYRDKADSSMLSESSNWLSLKDEPEGLLLLGLENFLSDCLILPIRRYLKLSSFTQETLVASLSKTIKEQSVVP